MYMSNVKKLGVLSGCAVAIVAMIMAARGAPAQGPPVTVPSHVLRADTVEITADELTSDRTVVRAFVPTGSSSPRCLATLSETNWPMPGISVFCAPRGFNGQAGIVVSAFLSQQIPEDLPNYVLLVTVYQEGAKEYGTPVLFTE